MAKHSYTITMEGLDTLHSVGCVLEWLFPITMHQTAPERWEGEINNLDVKDKLDYELVIRAGGRVEVTYVITNKSNGKKVATDTIYTNVKISNGAIVRGNCEPS